MQPSRSAAPISPAAVEAAQKIRAYGAGNLGWYCENFLRVTDRESATGAAFIPLRFNPMQEALTAFRERICRFNEARTTILQAIDPSVPISKYPIRGVILKSRKGGASTWCQAVAWWRSEHEPGTRSLVMTPKEDNSTIISRISRTFHHQFPREKVADGIGVPAEAFRVPIQRSADDVIEWEPQHGSLYVIRTAGSRVREQGDTHHFQHYSELSRFADEAEVASAQASAVKYCETWEESTANGEGNHFYRVWQNAMDIETAEKLLASGEPFPAKWNGRFRFFWPWWQDPGYRLPLYPGEARRLDASLDQEETEGIRDFGWTLEQIKWRREKIATECSDQAALDPVDFFRQEYPSTPEEAFVSKGLTFFDQRRLKILQKEAEDRESEPLIARREARPTDFDKPAPELWNINVCPRASMANLFRFEKPSKGALYVAGVDVSEGLDKGDWSVASFWNRGSGIDAMTEAARLRIKCDAEELGELVVKIAEEYNEAFLVPERTGPGIATCKKIVALKYPHIYHFRNPELVTDHDDPESFTAGFGMYARQRRMVLERAAIMLRDGLVVLRHPQAIYEWKIFQNINGKPQAPPGEFDDCVMADGLAIFGHTEPGVAPYLAHRKEELDDEEMFAALKEDGPRLGASQRDHARFWDRFKVWKERQNAKNMREIRRARRVFDPFS